MATIIETYSEKFRKSGEMFERAADLIPGGGHQSRTVYPHPVYVERGEGGLKWDVDGNELVDHMLGYGALILGNAHPEVTRAIGDRLAEGTHMGTATPLELRWAELVKDLVPSAERVRFTASGTESTLLAFRLARAFTGKRRVVKFREHFHGWHDYVSPESGINTQSGIPDETLSSVVVIEPKIEALERLLERDKDIAGVIMEPTGGHWGQFPLANPGFLQSVRDLTASHGVVMIMDEVITMFRMSRGGAQERFGVTPDLTTMAKIVAGGLPGGSVAGRADIMDLMGRADAPNRLAHPGTFNGNPVSASAGIAALEVIASEPINEQADAMAARLKAGLRDSLSRQEVTGHVHGIASIVHVVLGLECDCGGDICTLPHSEIARVTGADAEYGGLSGPLKMAMLNEGVDMMGGIGFMVSATHRDEDIDRTAEAFERSLTALRHEGYV